MEQLPKKIIPQSQTDTPLCELQTCSVCGEAIERVMTQEKRALCDKTGFFPRIKVGELYPAICRCENEKFYKEQEREKMQKAAKERSERPRLQGLTDPLYRYMTFSADLGYNQQVSKIARQYVENFERMLVDNTGLLFVGDVGTGRTFFASCIVDALIERGFSAIMTTFPRIINADFDNFARMMQVIERSDLVVLDDVGAERDSSFANERAFAAIDIRVRARKPIIVTTNLTPNEMGSVDDIKLKRIYDRILGACITIPVNGRSVRVNEQVKKAESARSLLLGESTD